MKRSLHELGPLASLLVVQVILLGRIAWETAPGWDEWAHLPSGLYHLQYGDYHPYRVNPPLARVLSALPVLASGGAYDGPLIPERPNLRSEWYLMLSYTHQLGPAFFFQISIARSAMIAVASSGTILIKKIGDHLYGSSAGWVAAFLWVFSPTVLTFGASITPDVTAAVTGLWATWRTYHWLRNGTWATSVWLAVSIGLAMLSKLTWVVLPGIVFVMCLGYLWPRRRRVAWSTRFYQSFFIAFLAWLILHFGYEFQGFAQPLGEFDFVSQALSGNDNSQRLVPPKLGNQLTSVLPGWIPVLLPQQYVYGIDVQRRDFEIKLGSYLLGKWSDRGWWYYYIVAWLVKEPPAIFLIALSGHAWLIGQRRVVSSRRRAAHWIMLLPGALVFLLVSSQTGFNHHLRYVLPAFPAFFLWAAGPVASMGHRGRSLVALGCIWFAASSLSVIPRTYSYFSEVIGGPRRGHLYLNASNLDWGQDLLTIRDWTRRHPDRRPVHMLYSPEVLDFKRLGIDATDGQSRTAGDNPPADGWWVVSIGSLLSDQFRWFREQPIYDELSVTTRVILVQNGRAVARGRK